MNKFVKITMALLSMIFVFSCTDPLSDPNSLKISPSEVKIDQLGGTFTVEVTSASDYEFIIPEDSKWITLDEKASINDNFTFVVAEAAGERTGTVIFKNQTTEKSVTVHQNGDTSEGAAEFRKQDALGFYYEGGSFICEDGLFQSAIVVNKKGNARSFRVSENAKPRFFIINGLPYTIELSKYYNVRITQNFSKGMQENYQSTFFVEQISKDKVWLYNYSKNYGIIMSINE